MKILITTIIFSIIITNLFAQQTRGFVKIRQDKKDYIALVIGNSEYPDMPLANPKNDAEAVAKTLEDMGFIVDLVIDADKEKMAIAINEFSSKLKTANAAVFYFAGHGMQVDGINYLIPIGRTTSQQIQTIEQVPYRAVNVGEVLTALDNAKVNFSMVVLDACRNNPIGGNRGKVKGLASIDAPVGSLVLYATKAGDVASDGNTEHSPFTTAFIQHITTPGLDVNLLPSRITNTVMKLTNNQQIPGAYTQITESFTFVPAYTTEELEELKKEKELLAEKLKQKQYQDEELRIKQQKKLDSLQAEINKAENYDEDIAEIEKKQAEVEALDKRIEEMKKQNSEGADNLDEILKIIENRRKQKEQLEEMKKQAEIDKKKKEQELEDKKRLAEQEQIEKEKELEQTKNNRYYENLNKYRQIADSEYGQDLKNNAWNTLLRNLNIKEGSIEIDDFESLNKAYFGSLTVTINSKPKGATLFIDDKEIGTCPQTVNLSCKSHNIGLRGSHKYDYFSRTITVEKGGYTDYKFSLHKSTDISGFGIGINYNIAQSNSLGFEFSLFKMRDYDYDYYFPYTMGINLFTFGYKRIFSSANEFYFNLFSFENTILFFNAQITTFGFQTGKIYNKAEWFYRPSIGIGVYGFSIDFSYNVMFNKKIRDISNRSMLEFKYVFIL